MDSIELAAATNSAAPASANTFRYSLTGVFRASVLEDRFATEDMDRRKTRLDMKSRGNDHPVRIRQEFGRRDHVLLRSS